MQARTSRLAVGVAAVLLGAVTAGAQTAPAPAASAQPDFSKVEIKATKIAGTLYTLEGQGGTIGVLTGPDGTFVVDSQFAPLTAVAAHRDMLVAVQEKIAALVKQGRSADEVVAAKPTADFDAKVPQAATSSERFVRALHAELSSTSR